METPLRFDAGSPFAGSRSGHEWALDERPFARLRRSGSPCITQDDARGGEHMPAHRLQEEIAREPGCERSWRKIERIDAEHIVMRLVADGWARAEIGVRILYVQAADKIPRGARARP